MEIPNPTPQQEVPPQQPPQYPPQYAPQYPPPYPPQYPPQYPPAYPPVQQAYASPQRHESARAVVVGALNIIFAAVYMLFFVTSLASRALTVFYVPDDDWRFILMIVALGVTFLGLFIGGTLLLTGKAAGKLLTYIAAGVITVATLVLIISALAEMGNIGDYLGEVLSQILMLLVVFVYYPIVAAVLVSRPNHELHLN
jgi:hypothetical protein